jgi:hypothetical protein
MCCTNARAKCRSQYLLHMMPNLGLDYFFPLRTRWWFCTTWSDGFWEKKKLSAHVACSMKKAKSPKITSCGPSNFEGHRLHLNLLLKNPHIFGSSSLVIPITHYAKSCHLSRICGMTEMIMKPKKWSKFFFAALGQKPYSHVKLT